MSQYAKNQEYRLISKLESIGGVEVLEYYGSRYKNKGDFLVKIGGNKVRIDHKSFKKRNGRIQTKWLTKLSGICIDEEEVDGFTYPVIVFGFYKEVSMYAFSLLRWPGVKTSTAASRQGSWEITPLLLQNTFNGWADCIKIKMNGIEYNIYRLEKLVELFRR